MTAVNLVSVLGVICLIVGVWRLVFRTHGPRSAGVALMTLVAGAGLMLLAEVTP